MVKNWLKNCYRWQLLNWRDRIRGSRIEESGEAPEGRKRKHLRGAISIGPSPKRNLPSAHCPANDIKLIALFKEHPL